MLFLPLSVSSSPFRLKTLSRKSFFCPLPWKLPRSPRCICEATPAALAIPDDPTDRGCAKDCGILSYLKAYNNLTININNEGRWVFLLENGAFSNCVPWLPKFLFLMTAFQQLDAVSHQTKGTWRDLLFSAATPADSPGKLPQEAWKHFLPKPFTAPACDQVANTPSGGACFSLSASAQQHICFLTASNEFIFN